MKARPEAGTEPMDSSQGTVGRDEGPLLLSWEPKALSCLEAVSTILPVISKAHIDGGHKTAGV